MKFRFNPELGFSERRVYFNLETDSIEKFILRRVTPEWETIKGNNEDEFKFNDSIFVVFPKFNRTDIYFNNNKIKSINSILHFNWEKDDIYRRKHYTEIEYKKSP